jgi:hypothetical protein
MIVLLGDNPKNFHLNAKNHFATYKLEDVFQYVNLLLNVSHLLHHLHQNVLLTKIVLLGDNPKIFHQNVVNHFATPNLQDVFQLHLLINQNANLHQQLHHHHLHQLVQQIKIVLLGEKQEIFHQNVKNHLVTLKLQDVSQLHQLINQNVNLQHLFCHCVKVAQLQILVKQFNVYLMQISTLFANTHQFLAMMVTNVLWILAIVKQEFVFIQEFPAQNVLQFVKLIQIALLLLKNVKLDTVIFQLNLVYLKIQLIKQTALLLQYALIVLN